MNLTRMASFLKGHRIRSGVVLTMDRLLGRRGSEVSYEEWLSRNRLSSLDYLKMEKKHLSHNPLIGVTASMNRADRSAFFQSLNMQVYPNFRALKNCPEAEYILIAGGGCVLRPELLWECAAFLDRDGSEKTGLFYFDSDTIGEDGRKGQPAFRPDFDPDLLERVNYMGNVVLV